MTLSSTFRRPLVAAVALAAGAAIALTGCSSSDDSSNSNASASTSAAQSAELTVEQAQTTLRKALDANTPAEAELAGLVQFTDPSVQTKLVDYNKKAAKAGYTPDIYTVKSVKVDGDKATAVVAVKGPHQPAAIDMNFGFVNVDGTWKLGSEAVTMLVSMMR